MKQNYYEVGMSFEIDRYESRPRTEDEKLRACQNRHDDCAPYSLRIVDNGPSGDGLFLEVHLGMATSDDPLVWIPIPCDQISHIVTALKTIQELR